MYDVLIVDDEQPIRELLSRWLEREGLVVAQASDADVAMAMLESVPARVMLCDRMMPGHDGLWLVEQVRSRFPALGIVLATADDALPARVSLQPGVVGYLVKPFKAPLVVAAVRDALAWHQVAAKAGATRVADTNPIDAWLRGRAGRSSDGGE